MHDDTRPNGSIAVSQKTATPKTQQYTLKGVEREAVELMRRAANAEGMKIGAWVSRRMKEAASEALSDDHSERFTQSFVATPSDTSSLENRILSLEGELKDIASCQRVIMAKLLQMPLDRVSD